MAVIDRNVARGQRPPGGVVPTLVRGHSAPEPRRLTDEQQQVLAAARLGKSSLLILGGPGTGKTTSLVAAVADHVRSGQELSKMVVLTASRPAAQQLRARIVAELGATQRGLQVTTVHGWCQQLLHRFTSDEFGAPRLLSAPEQEARVRELLAEQSRERWPESLWAALGTRGLAREVRAILARARQLGFDPDDLARAGEQAGNPEWVAVAGFFEEYLEVLDAEGVIDYAELVHRARLLLHDEQVAARVPEFAATIWCDEFAELDRGMINVLGDAHRAGSAIVAFADPDTSVFGFRGADPHAVSSFAERFDRSGAPARTVRLTRNLRSAPGIEAALRGLAGYLPVRGVDHPAAGPLPDAEVVRIELADEAAAQAERVADVLRQAHLHDGIDWSQMAVITRSGQNAVAALARRLATSQVPVQVAGDELALIDELAVQQLLALLQAGVQLAQGVQLGEAQAAQLLTTAAGGLDAIGLRRLRRRLRLQAGEFTADGPVPSAARLLATELSGESLFPDDLASEPDGQGARELSMLVRMRVLLRGLATMVDGDADLPSLLWHAWSQTSWPRRLQDEALRGGPGAARAHRDLDAVVALFDEAERASGWFGAKGVRALLAHIAAQQIPADTARENDPRRTGVSVCTVHRAKGEQWRLVVLVGLQEGLWPVAAAPTGILRADLLGPDGLQAATTTGELLAAERRALLLGASRASERLVVVAVDDPSGETSPPSRFLTEFGPQPVPVPPGGQPSTLAGLVAQLRRVVSDAEANPHLRMAAARELARLAAARHDSGEVVAHGADPDQWWGLRQTSASDRPVTDPGRPIRLSGSDVGDLLACPRRWFLTRRARGQQEKSSGALFGTAVHALIAQSVVDRVPASSLLGLLDQLPQPGNPEPGWRAAAELDLLRAALEKYDAWADGADRQQLLGVEVGFEVPVEVDGQQIVLVGSVDRLELDGQGRLRVIDFKTTRQLLSADAAAGHDQLGIYQLAARCGAFDSLSGGTRRLADAMVVHLRSDTASVATRSQPSLDDVPSLDPDTQMPAGRTWVHDRIARAAQILATEDFHASITTSCRNCAFRQGCSALPTGGE